MVGRWIINRGTPRGIEKDRLYGVQLVDELFLDRLVDLLELGYHAHGDAKAIFALFEPARHTAVQHVEVALDVEVLTGGDLQGNDFAGTNAVRRNVHALAVGTDVTVANELTRLGARGAPSGAVRHVVETGLEELQQIRTGHAGATVGLFVEVAELFFLDAVDAPGLLLLAQLGQVLRALALTAATVHTGRNGANAR